MKSYFKPPHANTVISAIGALAVIGLRRILMLFILYFSLFTLEAQPQVTQELVRKYPSPISQHTQFQIAIGTTQTDVAHSIVQTTDGGYAVAGYTWQGGFYAYIAKLDTSGSLQWTRTFGGTGWDDISSIKQTTDGGYIAAGSSIFKLDANGTLQWSENISGFSSSIIQTTDGGYAVAGYTNSFGAGNYDIIVVKLNSSGTLQWAKTLGAGYAFSLVQTLDGGFAVAGFNDSIIVMKLNSSGTLQWARTFDRGYPNSIIQTEDGGYAVAGRGPPIPYTFYIIKLDSTGALQWTRTVWLRDGNIAHSIIQTADGGYTVAGYTLYVEGPPDWYIVKLSPTGTLQWSRIVGGGAGDGDHAFSIIKTLDGGYAVGGCKDSFDPAGDLYIVKYDSNWNTCGSNDSLVSSQSGTLHSISSVSPTVTSPTGFITPRTPVVASVGSLTIICVVGIQPISNEIPVSFKLYQNYPNPFNQSTKIKFDIPPSKGARGMTTRLVIYDALGSQIAVLVNHELKPGKYEVEWDGSNKPSGVYFCRLETKEFVDTKKMVLVK